MLAILRILIISTCILVGFPFAILFCLIRPRHRDSVHQIGVMIARMSRFVGIEVEVRHLPSEQLPKQAVWIANHQNTYDLLTIAYALRSGVVSIGKKSLKWIPLFGQIYWLSGNIMIDRNHRGRAVNTINQAAKVIKERDLSVWMFPEGTRSYGRGLLPFKTGAFHLAMQSNVPVLPLCCSSTHKQIKLNRWNNGKVIIEVGQPIDVSQWAKDDLRGNIANLHAQMEQRIYQLTLEARGEAADYAKLASASPSSTAQEPQA